MLLCFNLVFFVFLHSTIYLKFTLANAVDEKEKSYAVNAYWYTDPIKAPYTYMESTIIVPPIPSKEWQTLFIWPGLQPLKNSPSFEPLGNGVLQPVLTWGDSCTPNPTNVGTDKSWWISAAYVNPDTNVSGYKGCFGSERMTVDPGDALRMIMELTPGTTIWRQTVINESKNQKSVAHETDLGRQSQAWGEFVMEIPGGGWHANVPSWNVTNIIFRTNGNITNVSKDEFCRYEEKILPTRLIPGGSLFCTAPLRRQNECVISLCKFNQGKSR